jgi:RHS repeat-associated protein
LCSLGFTGFDYHPFGMLQPGRSGYSTTGGWATSSTTTNSTASQLTLSSRRGNAPAEYTATESIEFTSGFESGVNDTFEAYTVDGSTGSGSSGSGNGYAGGGYRYGFNGQEHSVELHDNSYTAEFWEYDSRIGRRWNVDPILKEYESPYASLGNNPIWNIDPNGSDTAKSISNAQVFDAIKIGFNVINSDIKNNKYKIGKDKSKELEQGISNYFNEHKDMTYAQFAEFRETVYGYYKGLDEVASSTKSAWKNLGDRISNTSLDLNTQIRQVNVTVSRYNGFTKGVITWGANVAVGLAAGAVGTQVGPGPKGPQINSAKQRAIIESEAGVNFTDVTYKRYLTPSRTVNAADLRRAINTQAHEDPQLTAGANAYYTTILRNGKSYNLKVIYNQESNTIYHFHYSRQAMGPLPKIKK